MTSDRIAYQTYNDVQSINAQRRDMWTVIAEAQREAREAKESCRDERSGQALDRSSRRVGAKAEQDTGDTPLRGRSGHPEANT